MAIAYHESYALLSEEAKDLHRALSSLCEEFEAVDWYTQRIDQTSDAELGAILAHNREEEMEHAAMALEWLRRRLPGLDSSLRTYLFSEGSILQKEAEATGTAMAGDGGDGPPEPAQRPMHGDLNIRKL